MKLQCVMKDSRKIDNFLFEHQIHGNYLNCFFAKTGKEKKELKAHRFDMITAQVLLLNLYYSECVFYLESTKSVVDKK